MKLYVLAQKLGSEILIKMSDKYNTINFREFDNLRLKPDTFLF